MLRVFVRILTDAVVVAVVLFVAAGTVAWPRAWLLLAVLLVVRMLSAILVFRFQPTLLLERATVLLHRDQPRPDRVLLFAFMTTAFIGLPTVAARDVFRWHVLPAPPSFLVALGLVLFVLGWVIVASALRENAFAVTVIRFQGERRHRLVSTGIYKVIRHPMYAGNPLVLVGMSLWLGSYIAALCAIVPLGLLIVRISLEERLLRRELADYGEYVKRVPYRLLPGIW